MKHTFLGKKRYQNTLLTKVLPKHTFNKSVTKTKYYKKIIIFVYLESQLNLTKYV